MSHNKQINKANTLEISVSLLLLLLLLTLVLAGPVCGTDGETYPSLCDLLQTACSLVRRQGRALQSPQLSLQQSHPGPCRPAADCAGMERLGQFSAWGVRATNFGLCVQVPSLQCCSAADIK